MRKVMRFRAPVRKALGFVVIVKDLEKRGSPSKKYCSWIASVSESTTILLVLVINQWVD